MRARRALAAWASACALLLGLGTEGVAAPSMERSPAIVPIAKRGTFELLTYNVAGLPEGLSRSRPLANLPLIGKLLDKYDIALVQEDFAYPELLRRALGHAHATPAFVRGDRLDFGDGLSAFARLPFDGFQRVKWASCHGVLDSFYDCLTPKGFSVARQTLAAGVHVQVFNLHMDAGWSPGDRAARVGQVEQLIEAVRGLGDDAVIVAGDTNIVPDERDLYERLLTEAGLSDACLEVGCNEPWRIDRVLFKSAPTLRIGAKRWRIAPEFVDAEGRPLSDHLPVAVKFEWRTLPAPKRVVQAPIGPELPPT